MPSHRILSQVHAVASRADSSPKDLLAIKAGRGSYSSPSVGHTSASKSIGEAIKNAKKTSPTPLTPGSPIIKRGSRGARRSSSQGTDFNFSEAQVGSQYNQYGLGDIYPCDIYPWRHIPIMGDIYPSWVNVSWVPGQHLPIGDIYP